MAVMEEQYQLKLEGYKESFGTRDYGLPIGPTTTNGVFPPKLKSRDQVRMATIRNGESQEVASGIPGVCEYGERAKCAMAKEDRNRAPAT